ncbi:MAG: MarR family winged helix-turn-helix transcriptional regulator [Planctomycetota bacterium]|jgi:DNA-binding MarR family transcriptional regulator
MGPELEKAVHELALRMRMIRAIQEDAAPAGALTEREALILHLLNERGQMTVTQIAEAWPNVSESTVSMTITKLWRKHGFVSKTISPENQRITHVELTDKGKTELENIFKQRSMRIKALFDSINMTDEEKQVMISVCQRGVKVLDQFLSPAAVPKSE